MTIEERIIRDCQTINRELPALRKTQYTIEDYSTNYKDFDFAKSIQELKSQYEEDGFIDGKNLILILFDKIKRREDIQSLVDEFPTTSKFTRPVFINYLLLHSSEELRIFLFISCSKYMPIPIYAWNCWPRI